jgi:hypothetical protein
VESGIGFAARVRFRSETREIYAKILSLGKLILDKSEKEKIETKRTEIKRNERKETKNEQTYLETKRKFDAKLNECFLLKQKWFSKKPIWNQKEKYEAKLNNFCDGPG